MTVVLGGGAALYATTRRGLGLSEVFFLRQDVLVLVGVLVWFIAVRQPAVRLSEGQARRLEAWIGRHGLRLSLGLALLVAGLGLAGWRLVLHAYPLSLDEFWARFDAAIFARGDTLAAIPAEWRPYAEALQPIWRMVTPGDQYWASTYLPVNAAFQALFGLLGSQALANAFWAGLSTALVYAIGRRLWPERRDAAVVAAILLATSSQLILTAGTAYAMSAHLALNLLWLWLFLRKGTGWQLLAACVAFAATGLHQLIFHPLFAAPFIAQLWLTGRWRPALFHTFAYAGIGLFWISYWPLMLASHGVAAAAADGHGAPYVIANVLALLRGFKPVESLGLMAENLVRFATWQNPILIPLALAAAPLRLKAWRTPAAALAAGIALLVGFVAVVLPYQGHGWGYRYLHGYLGAFALLAGYAWIELSGPGADRRAWAILGAASALALFFILPLRAYQASAFVRPYAAAYRTLRAADADIVMLDDTGVWFGQDLVRNDPFLRARPKLMNLAALSSAQVKTLCAHYHVRVFGPADARAAGVRTFTPDQADVVRATRKAALCSAAQAPPPRKAGDRG